jgi:hypothetical protein
VGKAVIHGARSTRLVPLLGLFLTSSIAVKAGRYQEFDVPRGQPAFKGSRIARVIGSL